MKKYINPSPIPNGGFPIYGHEMMDCFQFEIYKAIIAQYKMYNQPVVIYGCLPVVTGSTVDISAGMVYIDGDMKEVPVYSGVFPVYLISAEEIITSKIFKDQAIRPVLSTKNGAWSTNEPSTGEFIKYDPYTSQLLQHVRRRFDTPLMSIEWYPSIPNAEAFNENGLGKWEWKGYHFANGIAGTTNLTGMIPGMFNALDADMQIGNSFGSKTHQLSINELARFRVGLYGQVGNKPAFGNGASGWWPLPSGGIAGYSNYIGGDTPHNNMQPTKFGVWLQRID